MEWLLFQSMLVRWLYWETNYYVIMMFFMINSVRVSIALLWLLLWKIKNIFVNIKKVIEIYWQQVIVEVFPIKINQLHWKIVHNQVNLQKKIYLG